MLFNLQKKNIIIYCLNILCKLESMFIQTKESDEGANT